jgi:hypothetical protein
MFFSSTDCRKGLAYICPSHLDVKVHSKIHNVKDCQGFISKCGKFKISENDKPNQTRILK